MHLAEFEAYYYPAGSAQRSRVSVHISADGALSFALQDTLKHLPMTKVQVASRLGNTPRFLTLPDGSKLETDDNDGIDYALKHLRGTSGEWIHRLERKLIYVLPLLMVVLATLYASYQWGIPAFARIISPVVPDKVRTLSSQMTLDEFDDWLLFDTELTADQQARYQALFNDHIRPHFSRPLDLQFRHSSSLGANAFALPDGTVVFTDQIMALLTEDEFLAVAAHEAGHVQGDHSMRRIISSVALLASVTLITGDSEAISEILLSAPTLLMELTYSRGLEKEADDYALWLLNKEGIDNDNFATALQKIVRDASLFGAESDDPDWYGYLSTHPEPQKRIARFLAEP